MGNKQIPLEVLDTGGSAYVSERKIYPRDVSGPLNRLRVAAVFWLLGMFYLFPWLSWDGQQAVLFDLPARKFHVFSITFWPQDFVFLAMLLMIAAMVLFFFTALAGRLWCGYACPQTVWTEVFLWMESAIEGDRHKRIKLDAGPWNRNKIVRKGGKHLVWLGVAFGTGGAWIFYFRDAPTLLREFWTGQAPMDSYVSCALLTATTYVFAGHMREQVCTYMCPWPRIQGALVDRDTMAVTYAGWRGEPRGKYRKGESFDARGDCIDCKQCVAVCPTGVDIRDGFQLECIGCGLCIDACNEVMGKIGRPPNLIAYDSERNQELLASRQPPAYRMVRPRTLLYAGVLAAVGLVMLAALGLRSTVAVNILPDRNPLFVTMADGSIRNGYSIRVMNKEHTEKAFDLTVPGQDGQLSVLGQDGHGDSVRLRAPPDGVATYHVFLQLPRAAVTREQSDLTFELQDADGAPIGSFATIFRGPK